MGRSADPGDGRVASMVAVRRGVEVAGGVAVADTSVAGGVSVAWGVAAVVDWTRGTTVGLTCDATTCGRQAAANRASCNEQIMTTMVRILFIRQKKTDGVASHLPVNNLLPSNRYVHPA